MKLQVKAIITILLSGILILFSACNGQKTSENKSLQKSQPNTVSLGKIVSKMDKGIMVVFQDGNENYWFGGGESGVYKYDGKSLVLFTIDDGLTWSDCQTSIISIDSNVLYSVGDVGVRVKELQEEVKTFESPSVVAEAFSALSFDPVLYLSDKDIASIVEDSGKVERWIDQSSNKADAEQYTTADQPSLTNGELVFNNNASSLITKNLNIDQNFTLMVSLNRHTADRYDCILASASAHSSTTGFWLAINAGGTLVVFADTFNNALNTTIPLNTDIILTITYQEGTINVYIDGVLEYSRANLTIPKPTNDFGVGLGDAGASISNGGFSGVIKTVFVKDTVLSEAQLLQLYTNEKGA